MTLIHLLKLVKLYVPFAKRNKMNKMLKASNVRNGETYSATMANRPMMMSKKKTLNWMNIM